MNTLQVPEENNPCQDMTNKCSKDNKQFVFTKTPYLTQHVIYTLPINGSSYANTNILTGPGNMGNIFQSVVKDLEICAQRDVRSLRFDSFKLI